MMASVGRLRMKFDRKRTSEHAVSPVVGVMLMLVVTIIIAAVVSAFAGGLSSGTEKAPQASLSVVFMEDDGGMGADHVESKMVFEHMSGDSIPTRDISIVTYYTHPNGTVLKHTQTPLSEATALYASKPGSLTRVPLFNDMSLGYSGNNPAKDFGNYTWKTGDVLSSGSDAGTSAILGFDITDSESGFGSGSVVDVKILHTPSGKYILDKEVIVP
jgi:FlaG/FlaF family flagellin (archaellin)